MTCLLCYWSRPFVSNLVCCANEDSIYFRQVRGGKDTCAKCHAMSGDREDAA